MFLCSQCDSRPPSSRASLLEARYKQANSNKGNVLRKMIFHKLRESATRQAPGAQVRMPVHPGAVLRERYLHPSGMSADDLADALGVYDQVMHRIVAEQAPVSHLMASKLSRHLGTTTEFWIELQSSHDSAIEWTDRRSDTLEQKH